MSIEELIEQTREKFTNIANAIRTVTGSEEALSVDDMPTIIEELNVGVENGFVASFYNEEGNLIQAISVKDNLQIDAPEYECDLWVDKDGSIMIFPLSLTENADYYAMSETTYASIIYNSCGIDNITYPYLFVRTMSSSQIVNIGFLKSYNITSSPQVVGTGLWINMIYSNSVDVTDLSQVSQATIAHYKGNTATEQSLTVYMASSGEYYYSNFDLQQTGDNYLRLDVAIEAEEEDDHYLLQEKIATENGEIVPDEGYYGLSKVNVEVVTGIAIENGYTANFYDENGELIQSVAAKDGLLVSPPDYECVAWCKDNNGIAASFPTQLTEDVSYYAINVETYADLIYNAAGIQKSEYPLLVATHEDGYQNWVCFAKTITEPDANGTYWLKNVRTATYGKEKPSDYSNLYEETQIILSIFENVSVGSEQSSTSIASSTAYYLYTNFDIENDILNLYRLDVSIESETTEYYTVNFYDYDQALLETHVAKCGNRVSSPLDFTVGRWEDANEYVYSFPMTSDTAGQVLNVYAIADSLADAIYTAYGVNKETYPYVLLWMFYDKSFGRVYFAKSYQKVSMKYGSCNFYLYNALYDNNNTISGTANIVDYTDSKKVINVYVNEAYNFADVAMETEEYSITASSGMGNFNLYANFDPFDGGYSYIYPI